MSDRIELDAYGQDGNVARANGQSREARLLADMRRLRQEIAEVRRGIAEDSARLDRIAADSARRDVERARKDAAAANRATKKAPLINSNGTRRLEGFGSSHATPTNNELRRMGFGGSPNHAAYKQHVARLQGEVARAKRAHDAVHGAPPLRVVRAGRGATTHEEDADESTLTPYQRHVRNLQKLNRQ